MAGPSVLVRPVFQAGASSVDATLPKGARWYCAHTGAEETKVTGKANKVAVSGTQGMYNRIYEAMVAPDPLC